MSVILNEVKDLEYTEVALLNGQCCWLLVKLILPYIEKVSGDKKTVKKQPNFSDNYRPIYWIVRLDAIAIFLNVSRQAVMKMFLKDGVDRRD